MSLISSKDITGKHELVFNDTKSAKVRYRLDEEAVPGVTTFIDAGLPTPEPLTNWKIREGAKYVLEAIEKGYPKEHEKIIEASQYAWKKETQASADIGTTIHEYIHLSLQKKTKEALRLLRNFEGTQDWNRLLNCVHAYDEYKETTKDEPVALEALVGSVRYKFGGRFDALVRRNDRLVLLDFKTSPRAYIKHSLQLAAYALAIEEWMGLVVDQLSVLIFPKEEGKEFQAVDFNREEIATFQQRSLACLETYRNMKNWSKDKRFK